MRVAVPGTTIGMSVRKLSVAFDDAGVRAAAASARREGVSLSAWLDRSACEASAIEDVAPTYNSAVNCRMSP